MPSEPPAWWHHAGMLSWLIGIVVRFLAGTWRVEGPGRAPLEQWLGEGPLVIAMLHGELLPLVALHRGLPLVGLVSRSRDGDLAAGVANTLGYEVIRGSSSRGGVSALREASRTLETGASPAFTVDGPRGPAGVPQGGALLVSRAEGVPVVWVRAQVAQAWRLKSWDRFCIPKPFARVTLSYGRLTPAQPGRAALEAARDTLEACLSG